MSSFKYCALMDEAASLLFGAWDSLSFMTCSPLDFGRLGKGLVVFQEVDVPRERLELFNDFKPTDQC